MARGRGQGDGNELGLRSGLTTIPDLRADPIGWRQWWLHADIMDRIEFDFPADCSHLDLSALDLTGTDLRNRILVQADLSEAVVDGVLLGGADLTGAKLYGVSGRPVTDYNDHDWRLLTAWPQHRGHGEYTYSQDLQGRIHNFPDEPAIPVEWGRNQAQYYFQRGLLHREDGPAVVKKDRRSGAPLRELFLEQGSYPTHGTYEHTYNHLGNINKIRIAHNLASEPHLPAMSLDAALIAASRSPEDGVIETRTLLASAADTRIINGVSVEFVSYMRDLPPVYISTARYDDQGHLIMGRYLIDETTSKIMGVDITRPVVEVSYLAGRQHWLRFETTNSHIRERIIPEDASTAFIIQEVADKIAKVEVADDGQGQGLVISFAELVESQSAPRYLLAKVGGLSIEMPAAITSVPVYTLRSYNTKTKQFVLANGDVSSDPGRIAEASIAYIQDKLSAIDPELRLSDFDVKHQVALHFSDLPEVADRKYSR